MGFIVGIVIVFLGTVAGAGCVWLLKGELGNNTKKLLLGFAAGVMMARQCVVAFDPRARAYRIARRV